MCEGDFSQRDWERSFPTLGKAWKLYKEQFQALHRVFRLPISFIFFSLLFLHSLAQSNFRYSISFTLLVFFLPLAFMHLLRFYLSSLIEKWAEGKIMEGLSKELLEDPVFQWKTKLNISLLSSFASAGFFFLFPALWYAFLTWLTFDFLCFFIRMPTELKNGRRRFHTTKLNIKGAFFVFLNTLCWISLGAIMVFVPYLVVWYFEGSEVGFLLSIIIAFSLSLFLCPLIFTLSFLELAYRQRLWALSSYRPYSNWEKAFNKLGLVVFSLFFGSIALFNGYRCFASRDIPPPQDKDLILPRVDIKKNDNAFYSLMEAYNKASSRKSFEKLPEIYKDKKAEGLEEIISATTDIFPLIEKALSLPYFQSPQLENPSEVDFATKFPEYEKLRKIAFLCVIKARYLFMKGKEKEAFEWLIRTVKLGQMIEESPRPVLITYLVGRAVKEIGLKEFRSMIPRIKDRSDLLKGLAKELMKYGESKDGLRRAIKME
ncbi:MAG: hypothetical protein ACPLPS_06670, partial [bacterium]